MNTYTITAQLERRRSIKFLDFYAAHEKSSKITVFSDDFLPKLAIVCPKCVSWRSNQEWPSICADTVCYIFIYWKSKFLFCLKQIFNEMTYFLHEFVHEIRPLSKYRTKDSIKKVLSIFWYYLWFYVYFYNSHTDFEIPILKLFRKEKLFKCEIIFMINHLSLYRGQIKIFNNDIFATRGTGCLDFILVCFQQPPSAPSIFCFLTDLAWLTIYRGRCRGSVKTQVGLSALWRRNFAHNDCPRYRQT